MRGAWRAMGLPGSSSGRTWGRRPAGPHRPGLTTSSCCPRTMAGKPSAAPAAPIAPIFRISLRLRLLMPWPSSWPAKRISSPSTETEAVPTMHKFARWFAAACLVFAATQAAAQYPARPSRFIVPFPPGGGVDIVARALGEKLSPRLGQPIVIENKPGAGTTIGTDAAAKSAPDGYTFLVGPAGAPAVVHSQFRTLTFDIRRGFRPVSKIGFGTIVLVVPP